MYQTSVEPAPPSRFERTCQRLCASPLALLAVMLLAAVALRAPQFGNPVVQPDDQFYLLTGDRLLHGALPYVDIWDRKPIGLFLIYAAIRLLGGNGIVQYQLVATLFAAVTAFLLVRIGRLIAPAAGAMLAGFVYLLSLNVFGGEAGQSPVFYNLFTVISAWCVVWLIEGQRFGWRAFAIACVPMLLMGCAIQVKYCPLFEGAFFGLVLVALAHRGGRGIAAIAAMAAIWIALALLPTLAAWLSYAAVGHGAEFVYANFFSVFQRGNPGMGIVLQRLAEMVAKLLPLAVCAVLGLRALGGEETVGERDLRLFVGGWCAFAIGAVLLFGSYYDHYALPLLAPLSVAAARVFADARTGLHLTGPRGKVFVPAVAVVVLVAGVLSIVTIKKNVTGRGRGTAVYQMANYLRPRLHDCLFVYAAEPILYHLTGSCLPTRWPFPDHLNNGVENASIGVDPLAEVKRIMARRPQFVVSMEKPYRKINRATWMYMRDQLRADYRPALITTVGKHYRIVFERLPGR